MASRQKRKTPKDPNAEREAARYSRPIASREALLRLLHDAAEPMSYDEVAAALEFTHEDDLEALRRRLKAMVRDGQLLLNRREGYLPVDSENLVRGRIIAHPDGFGFLVPDEGGGDLYMNPREMRALMHGDRIVARITGVDRRGRREGAIAEILERANSTVVGRIAVESGVTVLVPDNKRIIQDVLIPNEHLEGALDGQIAVAEITDQPTYRRQPVGRVTRILGDRLAAGMEVDVAINSDGMPSSAKPRPSTMRSPRPTRKSARICASCRWSRSTGPTRRISMTPSTASRSGTAGGWSLPSPMSARTWKRIRRSMQRRSAAAHPCTSRTGSCQCCPRSSPMGFVHSIPRWIGCVSRPISASARMARSSGSVSSRGSCAATPG